MSQDRFDQVDGKFSLKTITSKVMKHSCDGKLIIGEGIQINGKPFDSLTAFFTPKQTNKKDKCNVFVCVSSFGRHEKTVTSSR